MQNKKREVRQTPKEAKLSKPNYVQITEQSAQVLLKILEFEIEEITVAKLKDLGFSGFSVNAFIKEAEADVRQFLAFNEWASTKSKISIGKNVGRHTEILEIKPDKIVTNPLSAKILLELAKASRANREVNKKKFIEHLLNSLAYLKSDYDNFESEINDRIRFLIKIGDICCDETVPNVIWLDLLRFHSQKAYVKLLVEKKLPKPS